MTDVEALFLPRLGLHCTGSWGYFVECWWWLDSPLCMCILYLSKLGIIQRSELVSMVNSYCQSLSLFSGLPLFSVLSSFTNTHFTINHG
jgi:hypothetical protein